MSSNASPGLGLIMPGSQSQQSTPSPRLVRYHTPSSHSQSQPGSLKSGHSCSGGSTPHSPSPGFHNFKTPGKCSAYHTKSPFSSSSYDQRAHTGGGGSTPRFTTPTSSLSNPFENGWVDRLHMPAFSPSVFTKTSTPSTDGKSQKSFRWSIDQLAVLHPADIEEMPAQDNLVERDDQENEEKIQRTIDTFFASNLIAPSPWTASTTRHKARLLYGYSAGSLPGSATGSPAVKPAAPDPIPAEGKHNVACQTALSLPMDLDLETILGDYFQPQLADEGATQDALSTSSLRRKLFFHGENDLAPSPVKSPPLHRSNDVHCVYDSPRVSPVKLVTPKQQTGIHTPSSNQFSSSPILINKKRNERTPGGAHGSFALDQLTSPELSPIGSGKLRRGTPLTPPNCRLLTATPSTGRKTLSFNSPEISPIKLTDKSGQEQLEGSPGLCEGASGAQRLSFSPLLCGAPVRHHPHMDLDESGQFVPDFREASHHPRGQEDHHDPHHAQSADRLFDLSTIGENSNEYDSAERTGNEAGCTVSMTNQDTGYCTQSLQSTNQDTGLHTNLTNQMTTLPLGCHDAGVDISGAGSMAEETSVGCVGCVSTGDLPTSSPHRPEEGTTTSHAQVIYHTRPHSDLQQPSHHGDVEVAKLHPVHASHSSDLTSAHIDADVRTQKLHPNPVLDCVHKYDLNPLDIKHPADYKHHVSVSRSGCGLHIDKDDLQPIIGTPPVMAMSFDCESPCTQMSISGQEAGGHYYFGSERDMQINFPKMSGSSGLVNKACPAVPINWDIDPEPGYDFLSSNEQGLRTPDSQYKKNVKL